MNMKMVMKEMSTNSGEKTKRRDPIDDSRDGKRRVDEAEGRERRGLYSALVILFWSIHARKGKRADRQVEQE